MSKSSFGRFIATKLQRLFFHFAFREDQTLFTYYYRTNKWGDNESVSGPGSTMPATENIRKELPLLFKEFKIKILFDAPCGDFNWFKEVDISELDQYIGGEIVNDVVLRNNLNYSNSKCSFVVFNILEDIPPVSDLWLCRDTLFHFSNDDIIRFIGNLRHAKVNYLLATSFPEISENSDIRTGEYRPINLVIEPFNLPAPLKYINDSEDVVSGKMLGLWNLKTN